MPHVSGTPTIYYGWWILAAVALCTMTTFGMVQYSFSVYVAPVSDEFGLSRAEANIGMILYLAGGALWSPVAGWLFDRYSLRYVMTLGALLFGSAFVGIGLAKELWLIALLIVAPAAAGGVMIGQLVIGVALSRWFQHNRARAIGVAYAAMSAGGLWLPVTATYLIQHLGWRPTFMLGGCIAGLLVAAVSFLVMRNSPAEANVDMVSEIRKESDIRGSQAAQQVWTMRALLRSALFWRFVPGAALISAFYVLLLAIFVPYATDQGISARDAAFIISFISGFALFGKLAASFLIDRFNNTYIYAAIGLVHTATAAVMLLGPSFLLLLLICCALGFAFGISAPLVAIMLGNYFGLQSYGVTMGTASSISFGAIIVFLFLSGICFDITGSYDAILTIIAASLVLATILIFNLSKYTARTSVPVGKA